METLFQHIRFGLRMLAKSPGYTAIAVAALALGIGANTAIFSVVNAVLLKPLPYLASPRLVYVESGDPQRGVEKFGGVSPADFRDLKAQSQTFEQLVAFSGDGGVGITDEPREVLRGPRVTTNFFDALGAKAILGRTFTAEDGLMRSQDTVVISHRVWQRRFNGDPNVIGKFVENGQALIIGVMPPDFSIPQPDFTDCWIPRSSDSGENNLRRERYLNVVGLIKPDQTIASAEAELKMIAARLGAQYPDSNKKITVALTPVRQRFVRDLKSSLLLMFGAVGCVLLIACANVANLMLARAAARRKEMAIRAALGASRGRLIGQMLIESVMLSVAGGALGLLIALWSKDVLIGLLPESYSYLQLDAQLRIDGAVMLFTLAVALLTGVLFGLIPAWKVSRPDVNEFLKEGSRGSDGVLHQRTRGALVVAEIALAMVLLIGAGLLIGSFVRLRGVELGFNPTHLFSTGIDVSPAKYRDEPSRVQFIKRMQERVAGAPGVESVAMATGMLFPYLQFPFNIESKPLPADETVMFDSVSPNYFRVMQARMLAGRDFDDRDIAGTPAVAVINERLARRYFDGEDPVGKIVSIPFLGQRQKRQIVGVVRDISQGVPGKIQPQIYVPFTQQTWFGHGLIVRSSTRPEVAKIEVHRAISSLDAGYIPGKIGTPEETLGRNLAEPKLYTVLLGTFSVLALLLAAVGIYGVISYSVAQRTHEIGVRMALGARSGDVMRMVAGQGMKLALLGVAIGVAASLVLTRLLKTLLFGVTASDPATYAVIALLLTAVALLACWIPARRATRVDPMVALRYE